MCTFENKFGLLWIKIKEVIFYNPINQVHYTAKHLLRGVDIVLPKYSKSLSNKRAIRCTFKNKVGLCWIKIKEVIFYNPINQVQAPLAHFT